MGMGRQMASFQVLNKNRKGRWVGGQIVECSGLLCFLGGTSSKEPACQCRK